MTDNAVLYDIRNVLSEITDCDTQHCGCPSCDCDLPDAEYLANKILEEMDRLGWKVVKK